MTTSSASTDTSLWQSDNQSSSPSQWEKERRTCTAAGVRGRGKEPVDERERGTALEEGRRSERYSISARLGATMKSAALRRGPARTPSAIQASIRSPGARRPRRPKDARRWVAPTLRQAEVRLWVAAAVPQSPTPLHGPALSCGRRLGADSRQLTLSHVCPGGRHGLLKPRSAPDSREQQVCKCESSERPRHHRFRFAPEARV
jgi:hypothetical protein